MKAEPLRGVWGDTQGGVEADTGGTHCRSSMIIPVKEAEYDGRGIQRNGSSHFRGEANEKRMTSDKVADRNVISPCRVTILRLFSARTFIRFHTLRTEYGQNSLSAELHDTFPHEQPPSSNLHGRSSGPRRKQRVNLLELSAYPLPRIARPTMRELPMRPHPAVPPAVNPARVA